MKGDTFMSLPITGASRRARSSTPRWPRRRRIAIPAVLGAAVLSLTAVSAANANSITTEFGKATGYSLSSPAIYNGSLTDYPNGSRCEEMVRKATDGSVTSTGFHSGSRTGPSADIQACAGGQDAVTVTWHIVNKSAVNGIGFRPTSGGSVVWLCSTASECQAMH
jgi:hypothetical protein